MKHHDDFLAHLDLIENNTVVPRRTEITGAMKEKLDTLSLWLNYQKLKIRFHLTDDFTGEEKLLYEFFGTRDIRELEIKLSQLRKRVEQADYRR